MVIASSSAAAFAQHLSSSSSLTRAPNHTVTARSGALSFLVGKDSKVLESQGCKVAGNRKWLKVLALRNSKASAITEDSWEELVLNNSAPVLVEFYASWCGPCKMVHRVVDEIAQEYAGRLTCFTLNVDTDLYIAEDYEIKAVPVVVLFKNGKKHQSVFGTMPKEYYVAAIEKIL